MKLVQYKNFKEQIKADYVFTSWTRMKIQVDNQVYDIVPVNVGGTQYPFVRIKSEDIVEENEKNFKIDVINKYLNKKELKHAHYDFDGIDYYIAGIGYEKIKVFKNYAEKPKFIPYGSLEGEYLLEKLYNIITEKQSVLV